MTTYMYTAQQACIMCMRSQCASQKGCHAHASCSARSGLHSHKGRCRGAVPDAVPRQVNNTHTDQHQTLFLTGSCATVSPTVIPAGICPQDSQQHTASTATVQARPTSLAQNLHSGSTNPLSGCQLADNCATPDSTCDAYMLTASAAECTACCAQGCSQRAMYTVLTRCRAELM